MLAVVTARGDTVTVGRASELVRRVLELGDRADAGDTVPAWQWAAATSMLRDELRSLGVF